MESHSAPDATHAPKKTPKKPRRSVSLPTLILSLLIAASLAFVGGTRYEEINAWFAGKATGPADLDLSSLQEVYDELRMSYEGDLDAGKLVDGAKHGLVDAAGDPYTVYFNSEEAAQFQGDLHGTFEGIGAEIGKRDDRLVIVSPLDGSPAKEAGVRAGDVIVKVNDEATDGWSVEEAVNKIRGKKGTTVKLSLLRSNQLKEVSITRDTISMPSVTSEVKDGIGILRISRFSDTDTTALAREAAAKFKTAKVKGVILDLRGNGGGYLETAQEIASLWLPEGKIVVTQRSGDRIVDTLKAEGDTPLKGIPTVVLVDGASASASEIVAGALADHDVATLVGEKTYGKGSVQTVEDLPDGGKLKVTVARWFTPNGKNIAKEGISPQVKVAPSEADIKAERDPAFDKARQMIEQGL